MTTATDSFFGGAPGLSWPKADANHVYSDTRLRGVSRGGLIVKDPEVVQMTAMGTGEPIFWDREKTRPKLQMVITLLCDGRGGALDERTSPQDNGQRRLYIRGYMVAAVREALQRVNAEGPRRGGELYVAWIGEQPSKTANFDPARLFASKYVPPTVTLPEGGRPQPVPPGGSVANPYAGVDPRVVPQESQPTTPAVGTVTADGRQMWNGAGWTPVPNPVATPAPSAAPEPPPWEQPVPAQTGPPPATPFQQPAPAPAGPAANPYA